MNYDTATTIIQERDKYFIQETGEEWDGDVGAYNTFRIVNPAAGVKYYYGGKLIQPHTAYKLKSRFPTPCFDSSPSQDCIFFSLEYVEEPKRCEEEFHGINGILILWGATLLMAITALIIDRY